MRKLKFNVLVASACFALCSASHADSGHGTITFKGTIIDAPCSISFQDANQTVQLGQISRTSLVNTGSSVPRDFTITLEQCDASVVGKKAHAAFTGVTAGTDLLAVSASAGDVGVRLTSDLGTNIAINGPAWQSGNLVQGDNVLHFKAMLKTIAPAAPATVTVNEGDFTGQANFTLSYL